MFKYDSYINVHHDIGHGGQGEVSLRRDPVTNDTVAIKNIKLKEEYTKKLFRREIENLQKVNSPYVVKYLAHEEHKHYAEIVMEYIPGNLKTFLNTHSEGVGEEVALRWLQQLVAGLATVWEKQIMHRDLKPANILLTTQDIRGDIKICDFGISKCLEEGAAVTNIGTTAYMAPEIASRGSYDFQADIWSLGIVFYEMLTGNKPPDQINSKNLAQMMLAVQGKVTEKSYKLLRRMLLTDPAKRISVEALKQEFRYMETQLLYHGKRCQIVNGIDFITHSPVVFKRFPIDRTLPFDREIGVSNCQSLVHWLDSYVDNTDLVFVTELCRGGDLHHFIAKRGPTYFAAAKGLMFRLLQGLGRLEAEHAVHETITDRHILLTQEDYSADIKFTNCCISKQISDMTGIDLKSQKYMSPEQIRSGGVVTPLSLIWSLGCVFYKLLTGKHPFEPRPGETVLEAQQHFQPLTDVSLDCAELIDNMLLTSEGMRITLDECLAHSFFTAAIIQMPALESETDIRVQHVYYAYSLMIEIANRADVLRDKNNVKASYLLLQLLLLCFHRIQSLPIANVGDWNSHYNDLKGLCAVKEKESALQRTWAETRLQNEGTAVWDAFLDKEDSKVWNTLFALCKGTLAKPDTQELKDAFDIIGLLYKAKNVLSTSKADKLRLHMLYTSLWRRQDHV